ncbi:MAG: acylphosphatase [bacterium]|nr:acylphosphatase [bacterium]
MKCIRLVISGRVQGVFFREHCRKEADKLDVVGYAKNMPDGSVEVHAEGEDEKLQEFVKHCKKGSFMASVKDVKVNDAEPTDDFDYFEVR